MPVLQFHLVVSAYPEEAVAGLMQEAAGFYAAALYPEMERPPIERVRVFVNDVPPHLWATGGVPVSKGGAPAPYFTCLSLQGRPPEKLRQLMAGLSELVSRHLACAITLVRGQLIEIAPEHWFIAGAPASQARAAEITGRTAG